MQEQWKDIPGYEGYYQVSNTGRVRSLDRKVNGKRLCKVTKQGKILKGEIVQGRPKVTLCKYGIMRIYPVHQLVLFAFVGPCPEGMECCHNDGNRKNNNVENLRWGTKSENAQDAVKHGTCHLLGQIYTTGEKNHNAKLTCDKVRKIRKLRAQGNLTFREIGDIFNVSHSRIIAIVQRKSWKHVS